MSWWKFWESKENPEPKNEVITLVDARDFPSQVTDQTLTLPSKAVKEEFREKLARTNFWLAEMRKVLDIRLEVAVNWHPTGFNDCGLISNSKEELGFCFYSQPLKESNFEIGNTSIAILESEKIAINTVKEELLNADAKFNELLKEKGEELFSQIKRFFILITFAAIQEELTEELIQNPMSSEKIRERLSKVDKFTAKISESFPISKIEHKLQYLFFYNPPLIWYNIDFFLEQSISEEEFVEKLKTILPNLQNGFLGWTLVAEQTIEDIACNFLIYPRHF